MTSARKLEANRRNAQRSSGPRSVQGKTRASRNAFKHGLSTDIRSAPAASGDVNRLAQALCGSIGGVEREELALEVAAAWLELQRVKACSVALIEQDIGQYFKNRALAGDTLLGDESCTAPQQVQPVQQMAEGLARLQRYQRRAASRCKKLFRALQDCPDPPSNTTWRNEPKAASVPSNAAVT